MCRSSLVLAGGLLAGLLALSEAPRAADKGGAPYAGTWKAVLQLAPQEVSLLILEVQEKASGPKAGIVATLDPGLKDAKVAAAAGEGDALTVTASVETVSLEFTAHPPKGEKQPKKMLGSLLLRGQ